MNKKVGRPSKYDPKYCEEIVAWFRSFKEDTKSCPLFEDFADAIDTTTTTLHRWREAHPEFREAYQQCKGIQYSIMVQRGLNGEFNGGFTKYAMANMHGWSEKQEQSVDIQNFEFVGDEDE